MAKDDYASSTGGALKLKGAKNAGVDKKRKREKKKQKQNAEQSELDQGVPGEDVEKAEQREEAPSNAEDDEKEPFRDAGKTEAQRRHEEMRRRRLDERLKREGVKTHKERVEELNKYLSNLSEHHDMPRIGPG